MLRLIFNTQYPYMSTWILAIKEEMKPVLPFCISHVMSHLFVEQKKPILNISFVIVIVLELCVLQQNMRTIVYDF